MYLLTLEAYLERCKILSVRCLQSFVCRHARHGADCLSFVRNASGADRRRWPSAGG